MNSEEFHAAWERMTYCRWYVVPEDVIGGWAIAMVDKPVSEIMGVEPIIAELGSRDVADHIVSLHNEQLRTN